MDLERKVELMKQSFLHGYAAEFTWLTWSFKIFEMEGISPETAESAIADMYKNYETIQHHYDHVVPFYEITQEMSAEDWDNFAILFRVREILPKFKCFIDEYVNFLRKNNYHAPKESDILRRYNDIHAECFNAENHQGMNLKERIEKYEPSFKSEPIQSK